MIINNENILNINFNNQEVEVLKFNGEIVWQKETPFGAYGVKLTFSDGTTRVNTYSNGIIPNSAYDGEWDIVSVEVGSGITTIGESAFQDCSEITSITFAEGSKLTTIGKDAFREVHNMELFTIPSGVTVINNGVFFGCNGLKSIEIPNGVTSIGNEAFEWCNTLTSVTIPSSVTTIGSSAFAVVPEEGTLYCYKDWYDNLTSTQITNLGNVYNWTKVWLDTPLGAYDVRFTLEDGTTRTNNYEESGGVIPDNRYINNTTFTKVEFGDGIVSIGSWAFKNCSNCSEYIFSPTSNLQSIGDWCFESSFKYKEGYVFEVPNGVTYLGNGAFYNSGLARITLPNGLTVIDENTFNRCNILDEVIIPSSVTIIKSNAFKECGGLRDINLSNVEQIWSNAFENCGLETIVFPQSLQFVGDYGFLNCHNLKNVDLGGCVTLYQGAFVQCDALEEIDLKNVSSLKYGALWGCSSLTSVTMNEITDIEHQIFNLCPNLVEIHYLGNSFPTTLYNTFEGIGENGTLYHPNVSDASQWLSTDEYYLGYYGWKDGEEQPLGALEIRVTFTDGSTRIDEFTSSTVSTKYRSDTTVKKLEIGDGFTSIANSGFTNCTSLEEVVFSDNSQLKTIGSFAFRGCENFRKINLPSSLTTINDNAFNKCHSLESINIPSGITSLKEYMFFECSAMTYVTFETTSITTIEQQVFRKCYGLTEINIPNSVRTIGNYVFANCSGLTETNIPSACTSIGNYAFSGCSSLDEIHSSATTVPTISASTFYDVKVGGTLYYPEGSDYSKWLSNDQYYLGYYEWKDGNPPTPPFGDYDVRLTYDDGSTRIDTYSDGIIPNSAYTSGTTIVDVEIGSGITKIGKSAFASCSGLTSVTIPDSVTRLDKSVFANCTSLTSVAIPDSVTSMDGDVFHSCSNLTDVKFSSGIDYIQINTFYNCTSLTSIEIPNNYKNIEASAFQNCSSLTSVTIPDSVTYIGQSAFASCSGLTSVTIPDSVTSFGSQVFYGCTNLTSIAIPSGATSIGTLMFANCSSLTSVTIPNSVTTIGGIAFQLVPTEGTLYCYKDWYDKLSYTNKTNLGNVYNWNKVWITPLGDGQVRITFDDGTTRVDTYSSGIVPQMVYMDDKIVKVEFGNGITEIGDRAFAWCPNISSVTFSNTVQTIGDMSFVGCKFSELVIPNSVTTIKSQAFSNNPNLTSVTLSNSITEINNYIFLECTSLSSIVIPNGVTSIGDGAFDECMSLTSVTIPNTVETIGGGAFELVPSSGTLYCYQDWYNNLDNVSKDHLGNINNWNKTWR